MISIIHIPTVDNRRTTVLQHSKCMSQTDCVFITSSFILIFISITFFNYLLSLIFHSSIPHPSNSKDLQTGLHNLLCRTLVLFLTFDSVTISNHLFTFVFATSFRLIQIIDDDSSLKPCS